MGEFANYLNGLLACLYRRDGWCAVFWQRDPDGMRACLDGREIPPWDVVEALLHDLAAGHGPGVAAAQRETARLLHSAALTAYDTRPGARGTLHDRLDVMLREQRHAAGTGPTRRAAQAQAPRQRAVRRGGGGRRRARPRAPGVRAGAARGGGSRPAPCAAGRPVRRGHGGGRAVRATGGARLRGAGRTGEAHALLVEAARWPPARLPLLAAALHRAGLGADWATLLWETASLPAGRLVAAADALVTAGRAADGEQILRQGVVRPAGEIGAAVLGPADEGRVREVRALLGAYVRVRTPQEAARSAAADPQRLVPLLLEAARNVSDERHWDLVQALRVAGFAA
ncbi:hypothetical protein [Streptomyces sp. NPDC006012]|uniref:hypothetical protein n=1 Tax=Streptomyces sp. NPDC006012 TaxID=3364739 RepID=UPI0036CA3A0D